MHEVTLIYNIMNQSNILYLILKANEFIFEVCYCHCYMYIRNNIQELIYKPFLTKFMHVSGMSDFHGSTSFGGFYK